MIQNRVGRIGLGGNKYVAVEAVRGEMGWSSFKERGAKAILNFKVRMDLMDNNRWVKKVEKWGGSIWSNCCGRVIREFDAGAVLGISMEGIDRGGLGKALMGVRERAMQEDDWRR